MSMAMTEVEDRSDIEPGAGLSAEVWGPGPGAGKTSDPCFADTEFGEIVRVLAGE